VTFLAHICQKGIQSTMPGECGDLSQEIEKKLRWAQVANKVGLTFDITPFPYAVELDGSWSWRGKFNPTSVDRWFANYNKIVLQITKRAFELGAIYQVAATEMRSMHKHTNQWVNLAAKIRSVSNRPIVMNVSWFEVPHMFWKAFDLIGISAYYPIAPT